MSRQKSQAELKAENRLLRQFGNSLTWATVFTNFMKWGSVCFVSFMIYRCVDTLAGRATEANIILKFLGDLNVSNALAYILGGGGIVYGMNERRLKKRTIKRLEDRIHLYEQQIDPGRSSSRLGTDGDTNPNDRL